MRYQILYHNREPFIGGPNDVVNAPRRGVLVIVQDNKDHGAEIVTGADYYGWNGGRWQGYDIFGLYDYLLDPGWKIVLFGRMVTQDEYNDVVRQADIVKTGWTKRERRVSETTD